MSNGQGKLLTKKIKVHKQNTNQGMFLKNLPWLVNRNLCLKIIFLSQYCVQKQGILSVLGIAGYEWVPARIDRFYKNKIFFS